MRQVCGRCDKLEKELEFSKKQLTNAEAKIARQKAKFSEEGLKKIRDANTEIVEEALALFAPEAVRLWKAGELSRGDLVTMCQGFAASMRTG